MSYLEKLKESIFIHKKTVNKVHKYIETKYPQNTDSDNDVIIKDTLNRIVCKELGEFEISEKEAIVDCITDKALKEKDKNVTKLDVVEICNEAVDLKDKPLKVIKEWVLKSVEEESTGDVEEFLKEIKGIEYISDSPLREKQKHQEGLLFIPKVKVKKPREIGTFIGEIFSRVSPKMIFSIVKTGFISILIFGFIFFNYNENIGMAENNSELAQEAYMNNITQVYNEYNMAVDIDKIDYDILACHPFLPEHFDYVDVDEVKLKEYLTKRNSLLTDDKYFYDIIKSSKEFNLNPLILFAITGQEQGFVPRTDKNAEKIANNPFNVFVSWRHYNKNLKDSSEIAARTVINLAKGNENDINMFRWINRLYADDPDWYKGVEELFWDMMKYCNLK